MGGAWTRAGTLIIARAHRALDEIHDRFRELNVNDPRRSTGSHFAISHHPGEDTMAIIGRRWAVHRCLLGRCRSRVRSHTEGGGGNLYSDTPMTSDFRHQRKLPLVAGYRSFAVDDDAGREDTRSPLSGMGSNRIGSVPGIVQARPRKRPHATGSPSATPQVDSFRIDDRNEKAIVRRRSHDEALCTPHASACRVGDIVHTSMIRKRIIGLSPDQGTL